MTAAGRELAAAADVWRWPTGHTSDELDAVELDDVEADALGVMLRHGRSWVFNTYRRRLRGVGLSWLGIPTAELASATAQRRMARVLVLISRPANVQPAFTFRADCDGLGCDEDHGGHTLTLTVE
jgi:hypothetical protein